MKDNLNIEELFKEKFSSFESDVSPDAWTNIQQGINAANAGAGAAATKTGMSLFMKVAVLTGGIVAATVGGVYLFSDDEKQTDSAVQLVENTIDQSQSTEQELSKDSYGESEGLAEEVEHSSQNEDNEAIHESQDDAVNSVGVDHHPVQNVNKQGTSSDGNVDVKNDGGVVKSDPSTGKTQQDSGQNTSKADGNVDVKNDGGNAQVVAGEDGPKEEIDYPTGRITFSTGDQFAPSTYSFQANPKNYSTVRWDFGDGTVGEGEEVEHTFEKPGNYTVRLTVIGKGEMYEETQMIIIKSKSGIDNISNVITPNGDRINDFFIVNSHNIESFYIVIKDKNGIIVYESNDPDFKWYGTDPGGNTLENGAYNYFIYAKGTDGSEFKIPGELYIE